MGIFNLIVHRQMKKEANRLAIEVAKLFKDRKKSMTSAMEPDIIRTMFLNDDNIGLISEESRKRIEVCCSTINGYCYMMVLDAGKFKKWINFRSLQFTHYMDRALKDVGFPKQSIDQKRNILEVMGLAIKGWENWSEDWSHDKDD